jgi:hypothetical protein
MFEWLYAPEYLTKRFIARSQLHHRVTRKNDLYIDVRFYLTAPGQRSSLFREVKLWNYLPYHIKSENNS